MSAPPESPIPSARLQAVPPSQRCRAVTSGRRSNLSNRKRGPAYRFDDLFVEIALPAGSRPEPAADPEPQVGRNPPFVTARQADRHPDAAGPARILRQRGPLAEQEDLPGIGPGVAVGVGHKRHQAGNRPSLAPPDAVEKGECRGAHRLGQVLRAQRQAEMTGRIAVILRLKISASRTRGRSGLRASIARNRAIASRHSPRGCRKRKGRPIRRWIGRPAP